MENPSGGSCKRGSIPDHTAATDKTGCGSYIFISLADHCARHTTAYLVASKDGYIAFYIAIVKIFKQLCHSSHRSYVGCIGQKDHYLLAKLCGDFNSISQKLGFKNIIFLMVKALSEPILSVCFIRAAIAMIWQCWGQLLPRAVDLPTALPS